MAIKANDVQQNPPKPSPKPLPLPPHTFLTVKTRLPGINGLNLNPSFTYGFYFFLEMTQTYKCVKAYLKPAWTLKALRWGEKKKKLKATREWPTKIILFFPDAQNRIEGRHGAQAHHLHVTMICEPATKLCIWWTASSFCLPPSVRLPSTQSIRQFNGKSRKDNKQIYQFLYYKPVQI